MLKSWLPPKVWLHGSQSTNTGAVLARNGHIWTIACWLEHIMRWVVRTPLGPPVEPEVNSTFAIVSGPTAANARSTSGPGEVSSSSLNGVTESTSASRLATTSIPGSSPARALANARASATYTSAGHAISKTWRSLTKSLLCSELADTGTIGTPAVKQPSISNA